MGCLSHELRLHPIMPRYNISLVLKQFATYAPVRECQTINFDQVRDPPEAEEVLLRS